MTWQNNLDFTARVIKTSKRQSAVLMIDILTVCSTEMISTGTFIGVNEITTEPPPFLLCERRKSCHGSLHPETKAPPRT